MIFVQTSAEVNTYRDAFCFGNGRQVLLQDLAEGMSVKVVSLGGDLIEERALCGHEDDVPAIGFRRPDRARERLGLQYHPGPATVGRVVDNVMAVGRPLADVMHRELDLARGPRARDDALRERALEHLRE